AARSAGGNGGPLSPRRLRGRRRRNGRRGVASVALAPGDVGVPARRRWPSGRFRFGRPAGRPAVAAYFGTSSLSLRRAARPAQRAGRSAVQLVAVVVDELHAVRLVGQRGFGNDHEIIGIRKRLDDEFTGRRLPPRHGDGHNGQIPFGFGRLDRDAPHANRIPSGGKFSQIGDDDRRVTRGQPLLGFRTHLRPYGGGERALY